MSDPYASTPRRPEDVEPRCWRCGLMLARVVSRPWVIDCHRCNARNNRGLPEGMTAESYGATPRRIRARQHERRHVG